MPLFLARPVLDLSFSISCLYRGDQAFVIDEFIDTVFCGVGFWVLFSAVISYSALQVCCRAGVVDCLGVIGKDVDVVGQLAALGFEIGDSLGQLLVAVGGNDHDRHGLAWRG